MAGDFDESLHPRDSDGRFGSGGGSPFATPENATVPRVQVDLEDQSKAEGARRYALAAQAVAEQLHFRPEYITVTDREYKFDLNGKKYDAAGTASKLGNITLYLNNLSPGDVRNVTAHEIEHEKFNAFLNDYHDEKQAVMALPKDSAPVQINTGTDNPQTVMRDAMKPDGTLREPYDKQFPVYTAYTALIEGTNSNPDLRAKMAKEDGCTPYSKQWWDEVAAGKATPEQAIHETLAEMASVRMKSSDTHEQHVKDYGEVNAARMADATWKDHFAPPTAKAPDSEGRRFLTGTFSKDWQNLYNAISKNWEKVDRGQNR